MSTLNAIQKTIDAQNKAKAVKVEPNSADTSLVDEREVGVLISGSNGTTGVYSGSVTVEAGDSGHGRLGGDVTINSGDGYYAGNVYVLGGSNLTEPPLASFGGIYLETGGVAKEDAGGGGLSTTSTGLISIRTGDVSAPTTDSGVLAIKSGDILTNDAGSKSGNIFLESGGTGNLSHAGETGYIRVKTGQGGTNESGKIELITGDTSSANSGLMNILTGNTEDGDSGAITIQSGEPNDGNSGNVTLKSGNPQGSGDSGILLLESGQASSGSSGSVFVKSGLSSSVDSGAVYLFSETAGRNTGALEMRTGNSTINGNSGAINLYTGTATNATYSSGAISIYSGQGHTTSGALNLYSGTATNGASGNVSLKSGVGTGGASGNATLKTETSNVRSGDLTLSTGNNTGSIGVSGPSGEIFISTGTTSGLPSGIITIATGNNATGGSGGVVVKSGTGTLSTGDVSVYTSDASTGASGGIELYTGRADNGGSGNFSIETGLSFNQPTGQVDLTTGNSVAQNTGEINLTTGNSTSPSSSGLSGNITLATGTSGTEDSGTISITTGEAGGDSGAISIKTGYTPTNTKDSGAITIATGGAEDGSGNPIDGTASDEARSGDITLRTGNTFTENSGNVILNTGSALDNGSDSGAIQLATGAVGSGTAGGITISSGTATTGISGPVILSSGSATGAGGNSNIVMITTGSSQTGSYGTGPILVGTGNATGTTNTGSLMLSTGDTTGGDVGSVYLRTGIATDPAGVSDPAFSRLEVQPKETRYTTGNMAGATSIGAVDLKLAGGDTKIQEGSTPSSGTIWGGNVYIEGGDVREGSPNFGSEDFGNILSNVGGTQQQGEVLVRSHSVKQIGGDDRYLGQRLLSVQTDGILKALGISILGVGRLKITLKISSGSPPDLWEDSTNEFERLPLFFMDKDINQYEPDALPFTDGQDRVNLLNTNYAAPTRFNYSPIEERYSGQFVNGLASDDHGKVFVQVFTTGQNASNFLPYNSVIYDTTLYADGTEGNDSGSSCHFLRFAGGNMYTNNDDVLYIHYLVCYNTTI